MRRDLEHTEIERPDEHEELGDEMYCWMPSNDDRECNEGCVAFDFVYKEDQRRSPCMLINMFKSIAMSQAKVSNMEQVRARMAAAPSTPPPEVR